MLIYIRDRFLVYIMTKTDQLFNYVKQQIKDGVYSPGDKFPGGRDFAHTCNVSYLTANNVLQRLEQEGLLTRYPRKGSFVSIPTPIPDRSNETFKAGYFVDVKENYFGDFFKEVLSLTAAHNIYNIPLDMSPTSLATTPEEFQRWLESTLSKDFNSVTIYADRHFPFKEFKKYEKQIEQINFIYYDSSAIEFPNANYFTIDMEQVGYLGASHLFNCGAKKIFLDTVSNLSTSYRMQMGLKHEDHEFQIIKGIERAFNEYNMDFWKNFKSVPCSSLTESDYIHFMRDEKFDGFFSISNVHFERLYYAAKALNLKMGKNIHCIATGNTCWHNIYTPQVSTISFNGNEFARLTARAMLENLHGERIIIQPTLIEHNKTKSQIKKSEEYDNQK